MLAAAGETWRIGSGGSSRGGRMKRIGIGREDQGGAGRVDGDVLFIPIFPGTWGLLGAASCRCTCDWRLCVSAGATATKKKSRLKGQV
jgi:hypothetical protein